MKLYVGLHVIAWIRKPYYMEGNPTICHKSTHLSISRPFELPRFFFAWALRSLPFPNKLFDSEVKSWLCFILCSRTLQAMPTNPWLSGPSCVQAEKLAALMFRFAVQLAGVHLHRNTDIKPGVEVLAFNPSTSLVYIESFRPLRDRQWDPVSKKSWH